ncbi:MULTISPECIES: ATP-binding protein [Methylocaldum]|jgi:two-component system sensor histidine kinase UhpB|uniref:ATP-binding protein n=1 Tax=unclassified Methylocaldum TaxID=2622260 RepID=UPI001B742692|nr:MULTISPECIES: ATP-binding protein [unclassified Methylocaldum]MBP1152184.1 two-component system sensor histidine kinase UhpB [Methylocaldum sp. RMAD-M]
MHESLSLRFRLNLMIVLTMLAILGLGTLFAVHNARRSVAEEIDSTVNLALQLIEVSLSEGRNSTDDSLGNWFSQLNRLDKTRHLRIQVRQTPDRVDGSTFGQPQAGPKGESQGRGEHSLTDSAARGNPRTSEVPGWFAWAVKPDSSSIVAEKRVETDGKDVISILIEANPEDEIAEAWNEALGFLTLIAVLAVTIYALVHITVGRAFRCVGVILDGLEDIERGDYGRRLPSFSLPEFARISRAFNHMASTLEKARDENRALTQQSLAIQEEERRYLAQELHDELGQSLSAIKVMAASLRKRDSRPQDNEAIECIMGVCDRLFGVVRGMMRRLRPLMLDELGLIASLEDLIESWRSRNPGVSLHFDCEDDVDELAGAGKIHLFRIVQECLTNVVKHAEADGVWIELRLKEMDTRSRSWIQLKISDNGCGFDPNQPRRGFGLIGIRERVASLGGQFSLNTRSGEGVSLEVCVPCGEASR